MREPRAGVRRGAVDLVLIGWGAVGRSFIDLLTRRGPTLDLDWRVVGVATARHGCAIAPGGLDLGRLVSAARDAAVTDRHDRAAGPPPDDAGMLLARMGDLRGRDRTRRLTVVENTPLGLDGGQPGLDHVRAALDLGADVLTANKGPAAFAYRELRDRAAATGAAFRFEGTVLDGLPVFSLLRETLPGLAVRGFRGVLNTTTNHVLTAMEAGRPLDDAVAEMQAAGIAEADPSMDVDGWDAAVKATVLANVLLDADLRPAQVARTGLRGLEPADVRAARDRGGSLKLVATAARRAGSVEAEVAPRVLDATDPLARLSGTAKGLVLETDLLGPITITKSASDVAHTAYALLADLLSLHRRDTRR